MAIQSGDILLDSLYLGDYGGISDTIDTHGIVVSVKNSQVLVYWIEPKKVWGKERCEYEWFDLNNENDVNMLNNMKSLYETLNENKSG